MATSHSLATQVGIEVLRRGGNAVDAAVAAAATLNVVEPMMTGVGGDVFALVYMRRSHKLHCLNASGWASERASVDEYKRRGYTRMPEDGILSLTVPGAVHGWVSLVENFGTMALSDILEAAIRYAEDGFPVSEVVSRDWQGNLLLDGLCGAQVEVLDAGEKEHWECMMELADELRRKGCIPYITGEPDRYLGAVAYVDCVVETYEQLEKLGAFPNYIFVCSSNTTLAGLLLGVKCLGINVKVIGVDHGWVSGREVARERVLASANEAAERMGVAERVNKGDVVLLRDYIGEGYGKTTEEAVEAILIVARSEGILLDPVYTSKAMAGLIDQVRKDKVGTEETVLFIHTGGFPAIFAYNRELSKYFSIESWEKK